MKSRRASPWNWLDAGLVNDGAGSQRAVVIQTSLAGLIKDAYSDLGNSDLTVSPRPLNGIIAAGDPGALDVPAHASLHVLVPIGRPGASFEQDIWTHAVVEPDRGTVNILPGKKFHIRRLEAELKSIFTEADLRERCRPHDVREFWIRWSVSAFDLSPKQVGTYTPPDSTEADAREAERQEKQAKIARAKRVKATSQSSAAAGEADRAAAAEYAARQERARAAAKKS